MSFSADPCSTHTHRFRSEGAQFQILSLLHCYTNRLAGAWGQFAIGVCVSAHSADMCVTLPAGMWACGSHSGMLAHMCRFVFYLCGIKQNWQRLSHTVNVYSVQTAVKAWILENAH